MILNLLDRMKLPFRKNKEFVSVLHDILGFYPHNVEIYRIAFSHKSYNYSREAAPNAKERKGRERRDRRDRRNRSDAPTKPLNNERLEYLGDAVLETVVSDILFRHFENKREGFLTATRSKIVQREALNHLANDMGIDELILAAQGTRMSNTNIGGNAFEALMGAIYLDRGFKFCRWFIANRVVGQYIDLDKVAQKEVNFKSKLLEWSQKNRIVIHFKDNGGERDGKGFTTVITLEGITIGRGAGRSKKESQQEASKDALTRMRRETKTYDQIFRAKEKRTATEAEEAFALPKIEEIETSLTAGGGRKGKNGRGNAPVLEDKRGKSAKSSADAAYDTAYDENADFEVIDKEPEVPQLTAADYAAKGIPAPPAEDELDEPQTVAPKKRGRGRGAKTMGDAVKGAVKGATTPEERAEKAEAARRAESQKQRAKAERKAKAEAETKAQAESESSLKTGNAETDSVEAEVKATEAQPIATPYTAATENAVAERKEGNAPKAEISGLLDALTAHATEAQPVGENALQTPENAERTLFDAEAEADDTEAKAVEAEVKAVEAQPAAEEAEATPEKPKSPKRNKPQRQKKAAPKPETDFVITHDIPRLPESELPTPPQPSDDSDDETDGEAYGESGRTLFSEPETLPKLRHLSLDDFVFGLEPETANPADISDEAEAEAEQQAAKPKPRRRRPARKRPKPEAETPKAETQADETAKQNKPKPRRRRPTRKEPPTAE